MIFTHYEVVRERRKEVVSCMLQFLLRCNERKKRPIKAGFSSAIEQNRSDKTWLSQKIKNSGVGKESLSSLNSTK